MTYHCYFHNCPHILNIIFSTSFFATGTIKTQIAKIVKNSIRVISVGEAIAKNDLLNYVLNQNKEQQIEKKFEDMNLSWAYDWITLYDDINGIAENIVSQPSYYTEIIDYCVDQSNYKVCIILENGETHYINDIKEAIDKLL